MIERKIGFIGAGLMAEALVDGMLSAGVLSPESLFASDPSEERRRLFEQRIGENVFTSNLELVSAVDVVVLAVKPQVLPAVCMEVAPYVGEGQVVVSIAPGITLQHLAESLPKGRLVRVMPNAPALVREGASAFCTGRGATAADEGLVEEMLSCVGVCVRVEERLMDAVTGLSGSGPAFVYLAIEALSDGGVKMGLPRAVASRLAAQTVLGAARMVLSTGKHPGELKDQVATPGGTTIEGIHALEKAGVRTAFMDAVVAATRKCAQLRGDT